MSPRLWSRWVRSCERRSASFPLQSYRLPTEDDRSATTLASDELILELDVPTPEASTYLKAMDRRKWAFPLVGVAAARSTGGTRIALAGVAPIPWTLDSAAALEDSTPLPGTAYKVEVARALVRRALDGIAAAAG
jgi:xanthine dehydrogenase YagS FAD-binding subunit